MSKSVYRVNLIVTNDDFEFPKKILLSHTLIIIMFLNLSGKNYCLDRDASILPQIDSILHSLNTSLDNFVFYADGKVLYSFDNLSRSAIIRASVPLLGGKGGYGAKLKT